MSSAKWRPFCLGLNVLTTLFLVFGPYTDDVICVDSIAPRTAKQGSYKPFCSVPTTAAVNGIT